MSNKFAIWPAAETLGTVGAEYAVATQQQPQIMIWKRRQSADSDKRERLHSTFRRTHANLERQTVAALRPVFGEMADRITKRFNDAGTVAVHVLELWHQAELATPFNAAMRPCWWRMAEAGIHFEADWVGTARPQFYRPTFTQQELPSIDVDLSAFLQNSLRTWMKNRMDGVWAEVSKTMHLRIDRCLRRGLRDGLTLKEMAKELQKTLKSLEEYQAVRIARTETTGGMNTGGQLERVDLGIEYKEWISTLDSRTRGNKVKDRFDHISSNGEVVGNKDVFVVSAQKLMYPADGSQGASAGNICNCRCCAVGAWPKSPLSVR
jgi:hypothetical protein